METCPSENELLAFVGGESAGALETHLASCERCRVAVALLLSQTHGPRGVRGVLNRGESVGRYVVLELVGEGAMGRVYAAYDPVLDRKVALKLIHGIADGPEAQERLLREAKSLARVAHPNLVAVHDAGEFEGSVFIAMEFVDGVTLRAWRAAQSHDVEEILSVFLQAGRGLAAAHEAGLVHRDFKPENVLVGHDGRVRVSDFGLARLTAGPVDSAGKKPLSPSEVEGRNATPVSPDLARTAGLVGTPAYMAPEQLAGRPVDARADQFAFCVALHEALAGARPFSTNTLELVAKGAPAANGAPARVQRALSRGLSAQPDARFESLPALLQALEPRRNQRVVAGAAAAVAVAALVIGFGVGARRSEAALCSTGPGRVAAVLTTERRANLSQHFASLGGAPLFARSLSALDAYGTQWAALHRDACEATRVHGDQPDQLLAARMACLDRRLTELDGVLGVLATTDAASLPRAPDAVSALTPLAVCNDARALLAATPRPDNPQLAERVTQIERELARATSLKEAGRFREGLPLATAAALEAHAVGWAPLEAEALWLRGELTDGDGEPAAAEPMLRDAWARSLAARDDRRATLSAVSLSFVLSELNRMKDAEEWAWQGSTVLARAGADFDLEARLATQEGHLLYAKADFPGAEVRYRRAFELRRDNQGQGHPMTATMLANVANTLGAQGHFEDAVKLLREAAAVLDQNLGPSHPKVGQAHNAIAEQLLNLGRAAEALPEIDAVLGPQERALGPGNKYVARLLSNKAAALLRLHRVDEALALSERAAKIFEDAKMPLMVAETHLGLGDAISEAGRLEEALGHYRHAREVLIAAFGETHEEVMVTYEAEGEALLAHDHAKEAAVAFAHALEMREKAGGADEPMNAFALSGLGRAQKALGQRAAAKLTLTRAVALLEASGLSEELLTQTREALAH